MFTSSTFLRRLFQIYKFKTIGFAKEMSKNYICQSRQEALEKEKRLLQEEDSFLSRKSEKRLITAREL